MGVLAVWGADLLGQAYGGAASENVVVGQGRVGDQGGPGASGPGGGGVAGSAGPTDLACHLSGTSRPFPCPSVLRFG